MKEVFVFESEKEIKFYGEKHLATHTCTISRHIHLVNIISGPNGQYLLPVTQTIVRYRNAMKAMDLMESLDKKKDLISGLKTKPLNMYPKSENFLTEGHSIVEMNFHLN